MNLVNEDVMHRTFGKGSVVSYNSDYIKIDFELGIKKFIFPDVFGKYMTLANEEAAKIVKKKLEESEFEDKQEALRLAKERVLAQEQRRMSDQKKGVRNNRINPKLQSVFWCKAEEEEDVFTEWKIFVGKIKSGKNKGQPRQLARMNQRSACLLTKRDPDMAEKDRRILGAFMAEETFKGKSREDGYILAHTEYRLRLSEEESEKMLFWNYYMDAKFPNRTTWNSGKQRYFDNLWMAQILQDIISLRSEPQELKDAQLFFEHFCRINHINKDELPEANGALMQSN